MYCFVIEFFGSVKIRNSASLSNGFKQVSTGSRPIISGIKPKDFKSKGVELQKFVQGDNESVYLFYEKDLSKVADILKPRVKGANKTHKITKKKELSEEQRQKLRDRMIMMRKKGLLEKKQK